MGIRHAEADLLIGREALDTQLPRGEACRLPGREKLAGDGADHPELGLRERKRWYEVFDSLHPHAFTSDSRRKIFDATCSTRRPGGKDG